MKKIITMLVALMATLFTVNVFAFTPPPSPAPVSWISDSSHVLSDEAHARLDAQLRTINQSSANEIAALVVQSLDGEDIANVGDLTAKAWGVGKKDLDNGVLVVLAMKDRKSRISTGKGVEGDLPDLKANDILVAARPYLRKGDVEGALSFIFDSTSKSIANHRAEVAAGKSSGTSSRPACDISGGVGSNSGTGWVLVLVAGGAIALVWYLAAQAKRRRQAEEAERQAAKQRLEARKRLAEEREAARKRDAERARQHPLPTKTPVVNVTTVPRPTVPRPTPKAATPSVPVGTAAVSAVAAQAVAEEQARKQRLESDRRRREQEEESRRARERADEDRRRRERDDEDRRRRDSYSSPSISSSFDWGGSSGGSGGFGGGDSGGGGSSSDW